MRTVLALAIALFTTAPFPASAEQNNAQPLTEAAFAARSCRASRFGEGITVSN